MIVRLTLLERLLHRSGRLPVPVIDAFGSVLFGRAFAAAVRLGVFEQLRNRSRTIREIAVATGLSESALLFLLESCAVGGYVRSEKDGYGLTSAGRTWLLRDSPKSLVSLIAYFETLHRRWGNLDATLRTGRPEKPYYEGFDQKDWQLYVFAMRDLARFLVPYVVPRIMLRTNSRSLLDIGGSHGLYTMACLKRVPGLHGTILDFPEATQVAGKLLEEKQMEGRISLLGGDLRKVAYPPDQDAVLLFNVVHGLTPEENRSVVRRALEALRPGGKLYVLEQCLEGRRRSSLARFLPLMVGLNLLLEIGARTYAVEEICHWCVPARRARRVRIPLPGLALIEAER
jgi:DNA-binding transcriptional ArsR family regulator/predicted O-methyltransferase YrrM